MVKIPATREGLPAVQQMISEGININVTLIFSVERYAEVANAYLRGLERRLKEGHPVDRVASVASVFVSRIDTLVDEMLNKIIAGAASPSEAAPLRQLLGTAAVANSKMVYQKYKEIFHSPRFAALKGEGARVQRPLWGSTGTKNPAYSDLKYVEDLVGADTVNTVPPQTYDAILDHLKPSLTIERDLEGSAAVLKKLSGAGIDLPRVMQKLEDDGVAAFERSFDDLSRSLEKKRLALAQE
jgi:transaldolase